MPNLNVYAGGSPGGTDGTLIDAATNFLDLSGIYPIAGVDKYIYIPLCLRCNAGFRATSVRLTTVDSNFRFLGYDYLSGFTHYYSIHAYETWAQFDSYVSSCFLTGTHYLNAGTNSNTERTYIADKNLLFFGAYYFSGTPTAGTRNMFSISYVESAV